MSIFHGEKTISTRQIILLMITYTNVNFVLSKASFEWPFAFTSISEKSHQWEKKLKDHSIDILKLKQLSFLSLSRDRFTMWTSYPLSLLAFMSALKECIISWALGEAAMDVSSLPTRLWCWFPGFSFHISACIEILYSGLCSSSCNLLS